MDPVVRAALERSKKIYVTTYARSGRSGSVPVWFLWTGQALYFTTRRASLKARRILATGRASVRAGRADGPGFEARAEVTDDPAVRSLILAAYPRRYRLGWLAIGRGIRRRLATGESVTVKLTPLP
jgi:PPOX class probable F420-dependent enzyme